MVFLTDWNLGTGYSLVATGSSLYFLSLHWSSPWVHPFFSRVWWASLWLLRWPFYLVNCLSPFFSRKTSFSEVYLVLSWGRYSFISSAGLTSCVHFSVVGLSATSPGLKEWPYVEGVLWGPRAQCPLVTRAGCSQDIPCGTYASSCYSWVMIPVGGTDGQDLPLAGWLQDPAMTVPDTVCQWHTGPDSKSGNCFGGHPCHPGLPTGCNRSCFGVTGRGTHVGQGNSSRNAGGRHTVL